MNLKMQVKPFEFQKHFFDVKLKVKLEENIKLYTMKKKITLF